METEKVVEELMAPEMTAMTNSLQADTKGDPKLLKEAKANTKELMKEGFRYGILRCDYEYTPTRGDPGDEASFPAESSVIIRKVEGWTFEAAQRGVDENGSYPASEFRIKKADGSNDEYWKKLWDAIPNRSGHRQVTSKVLGNPFVEGYFDEEDYFKGIVYRYDPDTIEGKMKATIDRMATEKVRGITADVGFSQAFQKSVAQSITSKHNIPLLLSSLQQLSLVSRLFDVRKESGNKIVIMTANSASFNENKNNLIPEGVNHECIHVVGMEKTLFGQWVAGGNSFSRFKEDATDGASVEVGLESMTQECERAIEQVKAQGGQVVCVVQECAEMCPYSNALRRRFHVPVYDVMSAIQFIQMGCGFTSYSAYMM